MKDWTEYALPSDREVWPPKVRLLPIIFFPILVFFNFINGLLKSYIIISLTTVKYDRVMKGKIKYNMTRTLSKFYGPMSICLKVTQVHEKIKRKGEKK